jgi:uncharacterized membrane protein (UPF0182 family)
MRIDTPRLTVATVGFALLVTLFGSRLISLYIEYLWFSALSFGHVMLVTIGYQLGTMAIVALLTLAVVLPNVLGALAIARRVLRRVTHARYVDEPAPGVSGPFGGLGRFGGPRSIFGDEGSRPFGEVSVALGGPEAARTLIVGLPRGWIAAGGAFISVIVGLNNGDAWEILARWFFAVPFGTSDPIFGHDVSVYVFTVPVLRLVARWLTDATLISTVAILVVYGVVQYAIDPTFAFVRLHFETHGRSVRSHLLALGAIVATLTGAQMWLGTYDVLLARNDRIVGATFTDIYARLPATQALSVCSWLMAALLIATMFRRNFALLVPGAALFVAVLILGRGVVPVLVQKLQVEPAELTQERPYLLNNIQFTRMAYGLDKIVERLYPAEDALRPEDLEAGSATVAGIRLWDHRPLKDTYNQLQSIRPYYVFDDVDMDRYSGLLGPTDNVRRQVMLSARELAVQKLGTQAQTWVNQRLQYTHGYGVVMSPVNEVTAEGMPNFAVKDVPPTGVVAVPRPEVYFGEQTSAYVVVNTKAEEFDYPKGDQNVYSTYAGTKGIRIGSTWRRLAIAWNLGDLNLLVSSYLTDDSQLLMRRNVRDRVKAVAPFLKVDRDAYIVAANGRLTWMLDGYTTTDRFPYAQRTVDRAGETASATSTGSSSSDSSRGTNATRDQSLVPFVTPRAYNYIRNSVKITVDAYDGTTTFYLSDLDDPIIRSYQGIFPGLVRPIDEMPAELREHLRYPEDLFQVQSQALTTYHVQDPQVFYNAEDVWTGATEVVGDRRQPMQPYYVMMRIPGETREEFLLMLPFTPASRDNMISWLAARSDAPSYGELVLFKFPKDRLVYGPAQIDARIDQDPQISSQLTLWNQQGSRVIRGHLLVIPIGSSTLYVEPIYLQAETSRMPELKRVVVATGNRVVMEATLEEGLKRLFATDDASASSASPAVRGATAVAPRATPMPVVGSNAPTAAPPGARPTMAPGNAPSVTGTAPVNRQTVRDARGAYDRAVDALKAGDFARFGSELKTLDDRLRELDRDTGP